MDWGGASEPNKEGTKLTEERKPVLQSGNGADERMKKRSSEQNLNTRVILRADPCTLTRVYALLLDCDIIPKGWDGLSQRRESQRRCSGSVDATVASLSLFLCRITPSLSSSSQPYPITPPPTPLLCSALNGSFRVCWEL